MGAFLGVNRFIHRGSLSRGGGLLIHLGLLSGFPRLRLRLLGGPLLYPRGALHGELLLLGRLVRGEFLSLYTKHK